MKQTIITLLITVVLIFCCSFQDAPNRDIQYQGRNPIIRPIKHSNGNIELGGILLDRKAEEISFPAEYIIGAEVTKEYLITSSPEFSHESLFFTKTQPFHLQFMLLLLGADNKIPRVQEGRRGSIIDIDVEYLSNNKKIRRNIESWLNDEAKPMKRRGFYFLGSRVHKKFFQAQGSGKICSLWHQDDAILDIIHPKNDASDLFTLNYKNIAMHKFSHVKIILSLRKE
ncbi:YdjY domain-containing protein [Lentisphaera profundi]|uniref:YdjY domain-containing protein n=1 Tax=Lentisphaera profundi TaxID=1658616 RepID=A0ABY7VRI6_9BACT|nr:YdjY domain-containing protein [Lentisphaera profundi]WDE95502.1 YdjY domain-containing protein [Lentisphaera profundi]